MSKAMVTVLCVLSLVFGVVPVQQSHASEAYEYPELLVTPSATERLEMEAAKESGRRFTTHLPIQISALGTITAGIFQAAESDRRGDIGIIAGLALIAILNART